MTYIPGINQPIPGSPSYSSVPSTNLDASQYPMIYTTDGPLTIGQGLAFTNDSLIFDPGTVPDFGVTSVTGAYNNAGGITATPTLGDVVLFLNAATPVALGGVYGRTDPDGGTQNTFLGTFAGNETTTGNYNTYVGYSAGGAVNTGSRNTMVGATAGDALTSASNNTLVGASAGGNLTTGSGNALLGYQAGQVLTTGSNNTLVGGYQGATTISNQTILSDGSGNIRLWINNNGAIGVGTGASYGTSGQILTSGGAAAAPTWANPAAQNITGVIPGTNTPTNIYTTTIPNGGTFSAWGYLTVYSNQDIIKTYTVSFLNTYNSFSGMAGPGGTITAGASYTNPVLPEPTPSISVQYETGMGGGAVALYATAQNGAFNFSLTLFRTV